MTVMLERPETRTVTLYQNGPLRLESGPEVHGVRVAYRTWGRLNPARNNAILILHALTGDAHADGWWPCMFGEGKALDSSRSFLICAGVIGGCAGSSTLSELGHDPSIFDMARVQRDLLDFLGVPRASVIGGSMGGMLALALLARFPGRVEKAVVIGAPARQSPWAMGWNVAARAALDLDPARGLEVARQIAMLSYRSPASFALTQSGESRVRSGERAITTYLQHQGEKLRRRFTPDAYRCLTRAMDAFEIDDAFLRQNEVPTLVVGISSDELYPASEVRALAGKLGKSTYWELISPHGHDAFLIDAAGLEERVSAFLGK